MENQKFKNNCENLTNFKILKFPKAAADSGINYSENTNVLETNAHQKRNVKNGTFLLKIESILYSRKGNRSLNRSLFMNPFKKSVPFGTSSFQTLT